MNLNEKGLSRRRDFKNRAPGTQKNLQLKQNFLRKVVIPQGKLVGANGFEPSTSWSRTRQLNPINALYGVAYGTRSVISPLLVVPNLYLTRGVNPCGKRGFLSSLASLLPH